MRKVIVSPSKIVLNIVDHLLKWLSHWLNVQLVYYPGIIAKSTFNVDLSKLGQKRSLFWQQLLVRLIVKDNFFS